MIIFNQDVLLLTVQTILLFRILIDCQASKIGTPTTSPQIKISLAEWGKINVRCVGFSKIACRSLENTNEKLSHFKSWCQLGQTTINISFRAHPQVWLTHLSKIVQMQIKCDCRKIVALITLNKYCARSICQCLADYSTINWQLFGNYLPTLRQIIAE